MSHQVLARKWRPRDFQSLVGQEHVVRALTHALTTQRLHHAYLFTGTRGVGKTTIARILAKSLNCERGLGPSPCGVCAACTEIDGGRFVDYIEMDAASNRGVDEMTQVLENAVYAPTAARFKVYVIDEVHMLTMHAFNAMLKTLEEPPAHVVFVLATTDPQKVPVTVLSRCLQFNLKNMTPAAIAGHLSNVLTRESIPFEAAALPHIGRAAAGSMRDALSLLDQAIAHGAGQVSEASVRDMLGVVDSRDLTRLLDALIDGDGRRLVTLADEMQAGNAPFERMLQDFAALLQRIALAQVGVVGDDEQAAELQAFASRVSAEDLQVYYQIALHGARDLPLAADPLSGFTMVLLRLLAFRPAGEAGSAPPPGRLTTGSAERPRPTPAATAAGPAAGTARMAPPDAAAGRARLAPPDAASAAPPDAAPPPWDLDDDPSLSVSPPPLAERPQRAAPADHSRPAQAGRSQLPTNPARAAALAAAAAVSARGGRPSSPLVRPSAPSAAERLTSGRAPVRPGPAPAPDSEAAPPRSAEEPPAAGSTRAPERLREGGAPVLRADVSSDRAPGPAPAANADAGDAGNSPRVADGPFDGNWPELASRLSLGGLAQQVLQQSELIGHDRDEIRIRVPIRQLAEPGIVGKVRDALCQHFGSPVTLRVEVGAVTGQTATALALQQQAERLAQAREEIENDPFVQTLISDFGARVVPESIQPLDGA